MGAPKGNKFWLNRLRSGVRPKYETPEQLREKAIEYFEEITENHEHTVKAMTDRRSDEKSSIVDHDVYLKRPYTLQGLCAYLGMTPRNWYKINKKPEFQDLCDEIQNIIDGQTFEGGMMGIFEKTLVAKILRLGEVHEIRTTTKVRDFKDYWSTMDESIEEDEDE